MDPTTIDIAKVGGGGVLASALTVLAGRIFGGQDKVLARLDVLQQTLTDQSQKLAVLVATSEHRDNDVETLKRTVNDLVARLAHAEAEHGARLARLEAVLEKLSQGS